LPYLILSVSQGFCTPIVKRRCPLKNIQDLAEASLVCHYMRHIASSDLIWRPRCAPYLANAHIDEDTLPNFPPPSIGIFSPFFSPSLSLSLSFLSLPLSLPLSSHSRCHCRMCFIEYRWKEHYRWVTSRVLFAFFAGSHQQVNASNDMKERLSTRGIACGGCTYLTKKKMPNVCLLLFS